ncbi:NACHT domain-containing protein [Streptomyces kunmingensis]|uniref:NACHT domain-containing protein n=1 Tax=Streptomyces kunmingensis TaxID=68225 RepID=A0ABU6CA21_9ACTN|nr:NACHT domain-containing protein [Streptomyces kunmingensis]MEB3960695.1 NACHT domain-containing protein [Streptomyces kunmingensis]
MLGIAGALAVTRYSGLGVGATVAALLPTLAPAYLAWAGFRAAHSGTASVPDLARVADDLAQAVRRQWEAEAAIRRMNDPYPLPVAWQAAAPGLVEGWTTLCRLARAWPGGPPGDPAHWPAGADGLRGSGEQIGDVFSRHVPTQRLVVLGEPGTGKTMLLIRLLLELIEQRPDRGRVPVLFSLASWDPMRQELPLWLAQQLRRSHPGLGAPAAPTSVGRGPADLAQALVESRLILPLLDGFDELPPALRTSALERVNRMLSPGQPVVLSSRIAEYRAAFAQHGTVTRLNGAAGIRLLPLAPADAADYLRRDAGGSDTPAARRWDAVVALLGTDSPVGQVLCTPLGLFLARTIYNPRPHPGPPARPTPQPDELCDTTGFPTRAHIDAFLFNALIPAAYAAGPARWSARQAHRTFTFLARHLENNRAGSPDLAWWELHQAFPSRTRRRATGLMCAIALGLPFGVWSALAFGLPAGIEYGLAIGLAGGVASGLAQPPGSPGVRLRWSRSGVTTGVFFGTTLGTAAGLATRVGTGIGTALASGFAVGATFGIRITRPDLTTQVGPIAVLAADRRTFRTILLLGGVLGAVVGLYTGWLAGEAAAGRPQTMAAGFLAGLGIGFAAGVRSGIVAGLAVGTVLGIVFGPVTALVAGIGVGPGIGSGTAEGLAGALGVGFTMTSWGSFAVARTHLALRRQVPRDLMAFLDDAHRQRGVLRQVGTMYQFRHIDLQRHLAQQPWPPSP